MSNSTPRQQHASSGSHLAQSIKAIQNLKLPLYRTGVHAYLDGIITRMDVEEFGFPVPLSNAIELGFISPVVDEQIAEACRRIEQARYYHNRTVPWPSLPPPPVNPYGFTILPSGR